MAVRAGDPDGHTAINGSTRFIPGTHSLHAEIPSLEEEPRWMQLSVSPLRNPSLLVISTRLSV